MRQTSRHLCKFCCGSKACVLAARGDGEHGKLFFFFFCRLFLVGVHEKFSGHSVSTTRRRRIRGGKVSRGCIFK